MDLVARFKIERFVNVFQELCPPQHQQLHNAWMFELLTQLQVLENGLSTLRCAAKAVKHDFR